MPSEKKRLTEEDELTPEELEAQNEKFRTFFSTSVAQVPERMNRPDDVCPARPRGLFGWLFRREKPAAAAEAADKPSDEMNTGELSLEGDENASEEMAGLELALEPLEEPEMPARPEVRPGQPVSRPEQEPAEQPSAPAGPPAEKPAEKPAPQPSAPADPPEDRAAVSAKKQPEAKPAVRREIPRSPLEQQEDAGLLELKEMIEQASGARPADAPKAPVCRPEAVPEAEPAEEQTPAEPPQSEPKLPPIAPVPLVFAQDRTAAQEDAPPRGACAVHEEPEEEIRPEEPAEETAAEPGFRMFGTPEDELPQDAENAPSADGTKTELPCAAEEQKEAPAAAEQEPELVVEAEDAEDALPEPAEQAGEWLRRTGASLTLRCVLSALLAVVLLALGLMAEGLIPLLTPLDPVAAPAAFYGANLLLLAASMGVAWSVLRDGLTGLWGRASSDTLPALAAVGALVQAAVALIRAESYQASSLTLLSGIAALGLFMALLGSRVLLAAVRGGYELAVSGREFQGAYRVRDKELIRSLARDLEQKSPWVLLSRPGVWEESLLEQSLSERAGERRTRKTAYLLLGVALLSGLLFLIFGAGVNGAAAAFASVLCLGVPLSSTLVAGLASLRLQRTAAAAGAVVPGWAAIEELGGVDTVQVGSDDLFAQDSAVLEDIRIFKGGRIDQAILYSASILNQVCGTLSGLFRQIIQERTDILLPVRDLEIHRGLGFSAWCDNHQVLIGTREYLKQQDIPVPEREYEEKHSRNGELQVLYLAVSGNLYAMFVLRYVGGRNAARGLAVLQRESIRLLVACQDPSLTARHITEAYHLPEGMVTLLDQQQCAALAESHPEQAPCCMLHAKGFAGLTGGIRAAEQAQTAETAATTVQLVSVWFSVLIALLLTSAGSIASLSVAAVLMYQAAWSALSIAVCALKQHN